MGADNTTSNWSDTGTTSGAGDGSSRVDATQPLRTTTSATGGTGAGGVMEQAQEGAGRVVEKVQETAGDVAGQVRVQAASRLTFVFSARLGRQDGALAGRSDTIFDRRFTAQAVVTLVKTARLPGEWPRVVEKEE